MLTLQAVLEQIRTKQLVSKCMDGRDFARLCEFVSIDNFPLLGYTIEEGTDLLKIPQPKEWTENNIIEQLKLDVAFGYEKAQDERSISASMMYHVVKMWLHILEDTEFKHIGYSYYGLDLFESVANKYRVKVLWG